MRVGARDLRADCCIRVLAYLAALVMTMSIAFGTFLQQVVGFDGLVPVASNSDLLPGNLPRSESWTAFHGTSSANLNGILFAKAFYAYTN